MADESFMRVRSTDNRTHLVQHQDSGVPHLRITPYAWVPVRDPEPWEKSNPGAYLLWERVEDGRVEAEFKEERTRDFRMPPPDLFGGMRDADRSVAVELATTQDHERAKEVIDERALQIDRPGTPEDSGYLRDRHLPILRVALWMLDNNDLQVPYAHQRKQMLNRRIRNLEGRLISKPSEDS